MTVAVTLHRQTEGMTNKTNYSHQNTHIMSTMTNSVKLVGRPGADPTVKNFENKRCVAHFSLAVSENRRNAQKEWTTSTQWFNIVAWDKIAERMAKQVRKGHRIAINGKLQTRDWTDNNGRHVTTEIIVNDFVLLDPSKESEKAS